MNIAFTGHRPNKLGGYHPQNPTKLKIQSQLEKLLTSFVRPVIGISGMALGVDQWSAEVCCKLNIPFLAAVPFVGQESIWPLASQFEYKKLLEAAQEVIVVSPGKYSAEKMLLRDKWMVNHCDKLIAVWDGSKGGTGHTVEYAQNQNKEIIRLNPKTWEITGL